MGRKRNDIDFRLATVRWPEATVSALPAAATSTGRVYVVTDASSSSSLGAGGGSTVVVARSTGSTWAILGGATGSSLSSAHATLQAGVSMAASPTYTDILSITVPSLAAGKALRFSMLFHKASGANAHSVRLNVGGTLFLLVSASTANSYRTCEGVFSNNSGSQTANQIAVLSLVSAGTSADQGGLNGSVNPQAGTVATAAPFTFKLQATQTAGGSGDQIVVRAFHLWELP